MQKPKLITEDMMRNDAVIGEIWMHGKDLLAWRIKDLENQ